MKTEDLIVELARSAGPVRLLAPPSIRLGRWLAATAPLMAVAVVGIGPRRDVLAAMSEPAFVGVAALTFGMALLSAASALVLGVPGAERSVWQRAMPLLAAGAWTCVLAVSLATEGAAIQRLLAWPVHLLCVIEIAGLGVVPGWALFVMLSRAAPLERAWSGALATLAGVGMGAAATQFLCPLDDPAHQLIGHVLPVAILALLGTIAGQQFLNWTKP